MIQFLKKLKKQKKQNKKLGPETGHKPLIIIHTKIYLWSFVNYQYLKKYFQSGTSHWATTLSIKSIPGVTLSGNTPGY